MKRVVAILAMICLLLPSCGEYNSKDAEARIIRYNNFLYSKSEWNGNLVYLESYTYQKKDNPLRPDKSYEYTGYRMMMRDKATGEVKSLCVDPVCSHSIDSDCPMVSQNETTWFTIIENNLFYQRQYDVSGTFHNELFQYDLLTGDCKIIFSDDLTRGTVYFLLNEDYVFYICAEVIDKTTKYCLNRYCLSDASLKTVKIFDKPQQLCLLTDKRIYYSDIAVYNPTLETIEVCSIDYEGNNIREEPSFLDGTTISQDTFLLARIKMKGHPIIRTPYYMYYDIESRAGCEIPSEDCALSIGYNVKDGRFYYFTSEHAEAYFNYFYYKRADELGIDYNELLRNESELRALSEIVQKLYSEDKMYLKSCNAEGGDVTTHFIYPAGVVFASYLDYVANNTNLFNDISYSLNVHTGDVSQDGKWLHVTAITKTDSGREMREARISLETGEIEYP